MVPPETRDCKDLGMFYWPTQFLLILLQKAMPPAPAFLRAGSVFWAELLSLSWTYSGFYRFVHLCSKSSSWRGLGGIISAQENLKCRDIAAWAIQ